MKDESKKYPVNLYADPKEVHDGDVAVTVWTAHFPGQRVCMRCGFLLAGSWCTRCRIPTEAVTVEQIREIEVSKEKKPPEWFQHLTGRLWEDPPVEIPEEITSSSKEDSENKEEHA